MKIISSKWSWTKQRSCFACSWGWAWHNKSVKNKTRTSSTTSKKVWLIKYNNGQSNPTAGQDASDVMAVIPSKVTYLAPTSSPFYASSITKSLTDHTTTTPQLQCHIKTPTEDTTTDGLEVFSPWLHQSEDMMLTHMRPVTSSAKIIGEGTQNSLSSRMDGTWLIWTPDQEKPGDFGTGNSPNAEDGQCGDTSTQTTTEEPGPGLTLNHTQIAEPFEALFMIRIFIFLISIDSLYKRFICSYQKRKKLLILSRIMGNSLILWFEFTGGFWFYCMFEWNLISFVLGPIILILLINELLVKMRLIRKFTKLKRKVIF